MSRVCFHYVTSVQLRHDQHCFDYIKEYMRQKALRLVAIEWGDVAGTSPIDAVRLVFMDLFEPEDMYSPFNETIVEEKPYIDGVVDDYTCVDTETGTKPCKRCRPGGEIYERAAKEQARGGALVPRGEAEHG